MNHAVLYKKTTTGATQTWWMESEENRYRTHSGQLNSPNIVVTEWTTCSGKNIGKKNETSPEEQALLEVMNQYKKKLAQGNYKENIEDIDEDNYFKPMLAKNYNDYPLSDDDFAQGILSQPKLDGVRCIATRDGLRTRQGKPIVSCPHILVQLETLFSKRPNLVLDGELYNHSFKDDFNQIISLTRQSKPTDEDLKKSADCIQYHIYDCLDKDIPNEKFLDRLSSLSFPDCNSLHLVETACASNREVLDSLYESYVLAGYEGQMIRFNTPYENKRTKNLLKRKDFLDEEFEIVEIEEGIGNRSAMAGAIVYKLKDGRTFKSGIKGGFDFYKKLYLERNEYTGGQGKVRFFNWTPDGIPRFPVTVDLFRGKRED